MALFRKKGSLIKGRDRGLTKFKQLTHCSYLGRRISLVSMHGKLNDILKYLDVYTDTD